MSDSPGAGFRSDARAAVDAGTSRRRPVEPTPLSYGQQRHWFLDQIAPGKPLANMARAFRIRGWLDVESLRRSLDTIRERHEVLRSVFRLIEGHLVQALAAAPVPSLPVIDLGGLAEEAGGAEALRLAEEEARGSFDLAQGPLLRTTLLRLNAEEHVLVVVVHQAVFDERSWEIFDQELAALYEAFHGGLPPPLARLPIQYADFAIWQRDWLRGRALEDQLSYWKRQLEGAPAVLRLPSSRRRSEEPTFRGATETVSLGREMTEGLRAFSDRHGATLFMTLLAAFQALLRLHSGRGDVTVGSPVEGRHRSGTEGLIGPFANTLVFRSDLSGDPTFLEVLRRVREAVIQAHAHQDLPFEKLIEELNPERTLRHPPLLQVTLNLKNNPDAPLRLAGLAVSPLPLAAEITRYDLALSFSETNGELSASLQYAADLFDARTIRRMLSHLEVLLGGILEDPDRRLSRLPLMAPGERHQLLVEWNQTAVEYPAGATVVRLFEQQAERTPNAAAVEFEGRTLTYRELNRRSNRLASYLRGAGVVPGTLVALSVRRSPEMVAALLGVLKAGGAYVPLDPAYPAERLGLMVEDSGASVVLADRGAAASLPTTSARTLVLDDLSGQIAAASAENSPGGSHCPKPLLCHLHVRLHGYAQRGGNRAPLAGQLHAVRRGRVRPSRGGPGPSVRVIELRHGGRRDLFDPGAGRHARLADRGDDRVGRGLPLGLPRLADHSARSADLLLARDRRGRLRRRLAPSRVAAPGDPRRREGRSGAPLAVVGNSGSQPCPPLECLRPFGGDHCGHDLGGGREARRRTCRPCRSGGRSRTRGLTSSTRASSPCRSGSSASCMSGAWGWRVDIAIGPT